MQSEAGVGLLVASQAGARSSGIMLRIALCASLYTPAHEAITGDGSELEAPGSEL